MNKYLNPAIITVKKMSSSLYEISFYVILNLILRLIALSIAVVISKKFFYLNNILASVIWCPQRKSLINKKDY